MITYKTGNIFDSKANMRVCPANCEGIAGKGLALEFKKMFPESFEYYRRRCTRPNQFKSPKGGDFFCDGRTIYFMTKEDWKSPSKIEWIEKGLNLLRSKIIRSIRISAGGKHHYAFPALGCGLGGLDFESQVKPLMEKYLSDLPCPIEIYLPKDKD